MGRVTQQRPATDSGDAQVPDRLALLHMMMTIRRFEEKAAEMYARGRIKGFLHLYIGEEAVATGAIAAVRPDDYIISHYREHGHALARGLEPRRIMAELYGKETGVTGGRGGSMHLFDVAKSFLGGYAIVAGPLPLACGLALAEQYKGTERIAVNFLGDGAVNEGEYHESLNLAAIWKLPVLFIVENNLYGMGTALSSVCAPEEIYKSAAGYGIRSERVDGMNVTDVYRSVERLAHHVRSGAGPAFLEALCYRFRGHSMADAELYRAKDEVERWRSMDPILQLKNEMLADGSIDEAGIEKMQADVEEMVRDAAQFAEDSAPPPIESLWRGVYKEPGDA